MERACPDRVSDAMVAASVGQVRADVLAVEWILVRRCMRGKQKTLCIFRFAHPTQSRRNFRLSLTLVGADAWPNLAPHAARYFAAPLFLGHFTSHRPCEYSLSGIFNNNPLPDQVKQPALDDPSRA